MSFNKQTAIDRCHLFQGADCCSYLAVDGDGFWCLKETEHEETIDRRRRQHMMVAMGNHCGGYSLISKERKMTASGAVTTEENKEAKGVEQPVIGDEKPVQAEPTTKPEDHDSQMPEKRSCLYFDDVTKKVVYVEEGVQGFKPSDYHGTEVQLRNFVEERNFEGLGLTQADVDEIVASSMREIKEEVEAKPRRCLHYNDSTGKVIYFEEGVSGPKPTNYHGTEEELKALVIEKNKINGISEEDAEEIVVSTLV